MNLLSNFSCILDTNAVLFVFSVPLQKRKLEGSFCNNFVLINSFMHLADLAIPDIYNFSALVFLVDFSQFVPHYMVIKPLNYWNVLHCQLVLQITEFAHLSNIKYSMELCSWMIYNLCFFSNLFSCCHCFPVVANA